MEKFVNSNSVVKPELKYDCGATKEEADQLKALFFFLFLFDLDNKDKSRMPVPLVDKKDSTGQPKHCHANDDFHPKNDVDSSGECNIDNECNCSFRVCKREKPLNSCCYEFCNSQSNGKNSNHYHNRNLLLNNHRNQQSQTPGQNINPYPNHTNHNQNHSHHNYRNNMEDYHMGNTNDGNNNNYHSQVNKRNHFESCNHDKSRCADNIISGSHHNFHQIDNGMLSSIHEYEDDAEEEAYYMMQTEKKEKFEELLTCVESLVENFTQTENEAEIISRQLANDNSRWLEYESILDSRMAKLSHYHNNNMKEMRLDPRFLSLINDYQNLDEEKRDRQRRYCEKHETILSEQRLIRRRYLDVEFQIQKIDPDYFLALRGC